MARPWRYSGRGVNVFVLTTGRSGSLTFAEACRHITNYTTGHETRVGLVGQERLAYPDRHIEIDNRLAWFLGRLQSAFGDEAFYVHLRRDDEATAASHAKRWNKPAMQSYRKGILWDVDPATDRMALARDLTWTMNSNIELYLRDKPRAVRIDIETATETFPAFWEAIGAQGDLEAALTELSVRHHQGSAQRDTPRPHGRAHGSGGRSRAAARVARRGGRSSRLARLLGRG
jgi:hypothetical protein